MNGVWRLRPRTLVAILEYSLLLLDLMWIPIHHSWRLNERHYGALQGLNKAETASKYGDAQVKTWRGGYDVRPPELTEEAVARLGKSTVDRVVTSGRS